MKENVLRGILVGFLAAVLAYFHSLVVPLIVLGVVMVIDYITGMTEAWSSGTLSSRVGIMGIIKKCGYLVAVIVAGVVDYIIQTTAAGAGMNLQGVCFFGLLVTVWLILNECISILENLSEIGVPLPKFLVAVVKRLKNSTEQKGNSEAAAPEPQPEYEHQPLPEKEEAWLNSVLDPEIDKRSVSDSASLHPPDKPK